MLYKGEEKLVQPQVQAGPCCPGMLRAPAPTSHILRGNMSLPSLNHLQEQLDLENLHLWCLHRGFRSAEAPLNVPMLAKHSPALWFTCSLFPAFPQHWILRASVSPPPPIAVAACWGNPFRNRALQTLVPRCFGVR